jgi:hypothetical protein
MSQQALWPWLALLALGAFHGINPAMGWLFAVALGLQEKRRQAVWRALLPIALGHALSVAAVLLVVGLLQIMLAEALVRRLCGGALLAFGLYRVLRRRHPRWVGMRVSFADLTLWSFLMASAHGAGLMLTPILLTWSAAEFSHAALLQSLSPDRIATSMLLVLSAVAVHTLSLLIVTAAVAILVYEKLGLALLRHAWFNLDFLWVAALCLAGLVALFL